MTVPPNLGCTVPPQGWWCSREPGHDGPCAARPSEDSRAPTADGALPVLVVSGSASGTVVQMPDGLILTDSFSGDCGCVFGNVAPDRLGLKSEPGQVAFVCAPCSLICPTYDAYRRSVSDLGVPLHVQVRKDHQ